MAVGPVGGRERRQVHLGHGVDHKPRQVIGRQPLPHVRRQQEALLTATFNEVLGHAGIPLTGTDRPPLHATASVPSRRLPTIV